ncbi:glutathione S-transferase [Aquamicrobium sp. LC103]|uniref:glutathione S-transferase family protein n=1 Tax=Aquamicrobium sp. LC103 TaxID=1120658 RepID=UPI00063EC408|nr:glutathione S-transferase [Aquamicrobium sp. LC103]TKT79333.1 glutathione S-transferase [Aquamicrobium sp. LC103]
MLKFYHAPWSRSSGTFWLLEELGVDYEIEHVDIRAEGGVPEDYRSIQPNKKVPAIEHDGIVVTERAAICTYLADAFPQAGLAPAIGDPSRGPYLTWLVYCDAVFDPAVAARAQGWEYRCSAFSFGSFEDMVANVEKQLSRNEYAIGDRFTAVDTQLASGIHYTLDVLKVFPDRPVFRDYLARMQDRPKFRSFMEKDQAMAMATPFFQKQFADDA